MLAKLERLAHNTSFLVRRERERSIGDADIWTDGKRSDVEEADFRVALIKFYERANQTDPAACPRCMILDAPLRETHHVIASHIWKSATRGRGLEQFNLDRDDLNDPRNGLLLAKPIEDAFDSKRLCFIWHNDGQCFKLHLLDPLLAATEASRQLGRTFGSLQGSVLQCPPGKRPWRRLLQWHAYCSFAEAKRLKWPEGNNFELFKDLSALSEGARWPIDPEDDLV